MRRAELRLAAADWRAVESLRRSGLHLAREVNRAHILAALDRGVSDAQISQVLGVERTAIWRTRSAYRE
nr:helix-turn-helix domain-containing protein [Gammaproteobacteria bacterium]